MESMIGTKWVHYKTMNIYTIIAVGYNTEISGEIDIVYKDENNNIWIRPYTKLNSDDNRSCWNDVVDDLGTKRFTQLN